MLFLGLGKGGINLKEIKIPDNLYKKIEELSKEEGFPNFQKFLEFKLNEIILEDSNKAENSETDMIKNRLKNLGYID